MSLLGRVVAPSLLNVWPTIAPSSKRDPETRLEAAFQLIFLNFTSSCLKISTFFRSSELTTICT